MGEYDFYVKGILYTYKTDEAQKRLDDTIEIRYSPSDPYKCVMKNSNVGGNLGAVIFSFIFSGLMLFFVIFHVNLFKKSLGNGITKTDDGYVVRVAPADTKNAEIGKYFYDLQIGVNNDIFTVLKGVLELTYDVSE